MYLQREESMDSGRGSMRLVPSVNYTNQQLIRHYPAINAQPSMASTTSSHNNNTYRSNTPQSAQYTASFNSNGNASTIHSAAHNNAVVASERHRVQQHPPSPPVRLADT